MLVPRSLFFNIFSLSLDSASARKEGVALCEGTQSERDIFFFHENRGGFLQTWEPLLEGVVSSSVLGGGVQEGGRNDRYTDQSIRQGFFSTRHSMR